MKISPSLSLSLRVRDSRVFAIWMFSLSQTDRAGHCATVTVTMGSPVSVCICTLSGFEFFVNPPHVTVPRAALWHVGDAMQLRSLSGF
jgi:hypothetical protein